MAVNVGKSSLFSQRSLLRVDLLSTLLTTVLRILTSTPHARSQSTVFSPRFHCGIIFIYTLLSHIKFSCSLILVSNC